ncbi:FRG domain-containing protein [Pseudoalteromonas sp. SWN166]|uniref:FRG domain-containing protein n=1 Tax=Pseudoalteromonas sp. SWN166 TaxID=2792061 RepID=UPI0018CC9636|nr:FRG domain-containing protein [Pseudoalteromonas sp. SWN166]MBH0040255.1 FRG domain-containing protein [Pseudoalteromonas sp. SWN166]
MNYINSVTELLELSERLPSDDWCGGWFYRGQADSSWELVPKAYREPHLSNFEFKYKMWIKQASRFQELNFQNEFECMAIAQHHGFPTKFLDWSSNILVAAFFACSGELNKDAKLTAYFPTWYVNEPEMKKFIDYDDVVAYQPPPIADRIRAQLGNFTYHPSSDSVIKNSIFPPTKKDTLHEWIIPRESKSIILKSLDRIGINFKYIYPDIDGLSKHFCLMDEVNSTCQK